MPEAARERPRSMLRTPSTVQASDLSLMVEPIAVAAALLRNQMPDLQLREGATLMARVASRGDDRAVIVLAGIPLTAQVPESVEAGATLRLRVAEVTPERVTLQIQSEAGQGQ